MAPTEKSRKSTVGSGDVADRLLDWYDAHHRELPWRVSPSAFAAGVRADPYRVWLSEIMLQQTTVEAVKPYFAKFLDKWPAVTDLAFAEPEDVMKAWAGLGYYSRARNLKKCADLVAAEYGGSFPGTEDGLRQLPGIGAYTAAAIAAIAFGQRAVVIDGNVERVMARLFEIRIPLPEAKATIRAHLEKLVPSDRPGDFAQAMMDLGATICTPRRPRCMLCPLRDDCLAILTGDPELLPIKAAKAEKPTRRGAAFVALRHDGAILLRKRPEKGLLGGMSEVPTTGWTARQDGDLTTTSAPFSADWRHAGSISHVFTHFALELDVYRADVVSPETPAGHWWSPVSAVHDEALPTVMKKAIESAIPGATKRRH
ncbi:MAG: A/G-specific adenine glycosylase [Mesorhizobium sp.]|nr:A/G-specific adenine glycosylase [Mesorhizobium sp.]MBL8577464.1 A/G-specific adenine glycosylase [Mesorhizobium sp.]